MGSNPTATAINLLYGEILRKTEERKLIKISKTQRNYLEANGCSFPEDLHHTYGKHKTYYATESPKVKALLKQYEEEVKSK